MPEVFIYPWHVKSKGASALSGAMKVSRIKREGSTFEGAPNKIVINWGNTELPSEVKKCQIINTPTAVNRSSDKLKFFVHQAEGGGRIPDFTDDFNEAITWIAKGFPVVARTKLKAKSGAGIVFLEAGADFVNAPLYTKYIKKQDEYRVHFAFKKQIDVQKKALSNTLPDGTEVDREKVDWRVRNLANGFIFKRQDIFPPADVIKQAELCFLRSGLHFGAVDVIYSKSQDRAYVLEINTAPGLEGQTVVSYAKAFEEAIASKGAGDV